MKKIEVNFHPSITIAISPNTSRLIMSRYDGTYPFQKYRLAFNPLGGNPNLYEKENKGPTDALIREISEEFYSQSKDKLKQGKNLVKACLLDNLTPLKDIFIDLPQIKYGRKAHTCIYSIFQSSIPEEIVDLVEENIRLGKNLINEGFLGVTSLDALYKGENKLAHSSSLLFDFVFDKKFPSSLPGAKADDLGFPRALYSEYKEFNYSEKVFKI